MSVLNEADAVSHFELVPATPIFLSHLFSPSQLLSRRVEIYLKSPFDSTFRAQTSGPSKIKTLHGCSPPPPPLSFFLCLSISCSLVVLSVVIAQLDR